MKKTSITRFGPQPEKKQKNPIFYECGICTCYHPIEWDGDCRDDANRFDSLDLDRRYGAFGWTEKVMPV